MKIALVSPYDHTIAGGVRSHIIGLDKALRARGHEVKILAPASDRRALADNVICVAEHVLPLTVNGSRARITLSLNVYPRVKRILTQERFDIVHVHEPLVPTLPLFVLRHAQCAMVGTFHAYRDSAITYAYTPVMLRRLLQRLDARTVVSRAVLPPLARYFPGDYHVIPNGVDVEQFGAATIQPIEHFSDGKLNILFVGRLEPRKGLRFLLDAFARVKRVMTPVRLLVVGAFDQADQAEYMRYVRQHSLQDVHFVGHVSPSELPRFYRTAHVFCAPSTGHESFGLILAEALAAGVPIVASDIAGYRQVISHEHDGLLTPPCNAEALAAALQRLLHDAPLRERIAANGRQTVQQYDWSKVAQRTLELYEHCLTTRVLQPHAFQLQTSSRWV